MWGPYSIQHFVGFQKNFLKNNDYIMHPRILCQIGSKTMRRPEGIQLRRLVILARVCVFGEDKVMVTLHTLKDGPDTTMRIFTVIAAQD